MSYVKKHAVKERVEEAQDPWAYRSNTMKCKTCMWFVLKISGDGAWNLGRCRRRAPTSNGFPVVFMNDWCGDHKIDENMC